MEITVEFSGVLCAYVNELYTNCKGVIGMKKKLFLLMGSVALCFVAAQMVGAAEIGQKLTSQEVRTLLSNKTFSVQQFLDDGEVKDFQAYFEGDGALQFRYTENFFKSGQWTVGTGGEICLQIPLRRRASTLRIDEHCGTLVKRTPYSFDRMSDEGKRTATITLIANGNKFPRK